MKQEWKIPLLTRYSPLRAKLALTLGAIAIAVQAIITPFSRPFSEAVSLGLDSRTLQKQILSTLDFAKEGGIQNSQRANFSKSVSHSGIDVSFTDVPAISEDSELSSFARSLKEAISAKGLDVYVQEQSGSQFPDTFPTFEGVIVGAPVVQGLFDQEAAGQIHSENIPGFLLEGPYPIGQSPMPLPNLESVKLSIALEEDLWLNFASVSIKSNYSGKWLYLRFILSGVLIALATYFVVGPVSRTIQNLKYAFREFDMGRNGILMPEEGSSEAREVARAFNNFSRHTQKSFSEQKDMLNAVAHDLRTPMASLRIRSEFIEDGKLKAEMNSTLDEMERLTRAFLEAAKGGASQEEKRILEMASLIEAVRDNNVQIGKNVSLGHMDRARCKGRTLELKRMLQNLIDNALRQSTDVTLSLIVAGDTVSILVEDTGPGIPEADLERMIKPFTRLEDSRNKETGGFGLGLSIANSIAERHGGRLKLENREGPGLRVVINLPLFENS